MDIFLLIFTMLWVLPVRAVLFYYCTRISLTLLLVLSGFNLLFFLIEFHRGESIQCFPFHCTPLFFALTFPFFLYTVILSFFPFFFLQVIPLGCKSKFQIRFHSILWGERSVSECVCVCVLVKRAGSLLWLHLVEIPLISFSIDLTGRPGRCYWRRDWAR